MGSKPFIIVDNQQQISLAEAFQYLQLAGKLDGFIGEILRQYVLEQELQNRTDLIIAPDAVERAIAHFRAQNKLTDADAFQHWLISQELDLSALEQQIQRELKITQFKQKLAESRLQEYFIERKLSLDQLVLSRIAVAEQDLAEELYQQILEGASFEQIAQDYSTAEEGIFNGMMGLLSRADLPDALRAAVDLAKPGDLVGPLEVDQAWSIFRVEKLLPASLDHPQVVQTLQDELLDQWILGQLQWMNIEVQVEET